jgi:hypothetical protein
VEDFSSKSPQHVTSKRGTKTHDLRRRKGCKFLMKKG